MSPLVRRLADIAPQPWKNGLGRTRQLLARPDGPDWRIRISVADVAADGPFSSYPGVTRWFAVIEGAGVRLEIDGMQHDLAPASPPLRFDGAAATNCRLVDGPTRDLNLMLRGAPGAIHPVQAGEAWTPMQGACGLLVACDGQCHWASGVLALESWSFAWFDRAPAALSFVPDNPGRGPAGWWLETGQAPADGMALRSNPASGAA